MARMRTINESVKLIKDDDPDSAITYNFIRTLCKANQVNCFTVGRKMILDFDDLLKAIGATGTGSNYQDAPNIIRKYTRRINDGNGN